MPRRSGASHGSRWVLWSMGHAPRGGKNGTLRIGSATLRLEPNRGGRPAGEQVVRRTARPPRGRPGRRGPRGRGSAARQEPAPEGPAPSGGSAPVTCRSEPLQGPAPSASEAWGGGGAGGRGGGGGWGA